MSPRPGWAGRAFVFWNPSFSPWDGQTKYNFSSWSIQMPFIIVCSNLWGILFRQWRRSSPATKTLVWAGIFALVASTIAIGYGYYLATNRDE